MNPRASNPRVLAATLQWNHGELTEACVDSLSKLQDPPSEILVADNGSTDGSYGRIQSAFPHVWTMRVSKRQNLGYGEGVNAQIRCAFEHKFDYLFSVENDSAVEPGTLSALVQAAEEDLALGLVFPEVEGREGGFFLARMDAVKKAGYLDPGYFIYYDLEDWFERIRARGYKTRVIPGTKVIHHSHGTIGAGSAAFYYYKTRNRLHFTRRHPEPRREGYGGTPQDDGNGSIRGLRKRVSGTGWGLIDFIRGKRGPRDFESGGASLFVRPGRRLFKKWKALKRKLRFFLKRAAGQPLKIRVFLDWNIGDELLASPVYEALKRKYPRALIDTHVSHPDLVKGNPFVDSVNQGEDFLPDLVVDLHREIRSRPRWEYLPKFAGVEDWSLPRVYLTEEEKREARRKWLGDRDALWVAVNTETGWYSKLWPFENWVALAEHFSRVHHAEILVVGKEGKPLPLGRNLMGETSLRETAALLSQCRLYMGNDSGPLHLALAVGTPAVGVYGPLNPSLFYPKIPHFIPVWTEVECRGCWPDNRMRHPDHCPKIVPDCMTTIFPERVIEAGERLLSLNVNSSKGGFS